MVMNYTPPTEAQWTTFLAALATRPAGEALINLVADEPEKPARTTTTARKSKA